MEGGREKEKRRISRSFCQGDNCQALTQVSTVFQAFRSIKHCRGQEWEIIARKRTITRAGSLKIYDNVTLVCASKELGITVRA